MGIQFLLFAMANLGVGILLERQRGLWKRLRSAPISRLTLLAGKAASGAIISLMILLRLASRFAMVVFGVRIHGSVLGFRRRLRRLRADGRRPSACWSRRSATRRRPRAASRRSRC